MRHIHRFAPLALLLAAGLNSPGAGAQTAGASVDKPRASPPARAAAAKPGKDRWAIKTASDAEAREIAATPSKSTVEELLAIPRPLDMPSDGSNPFFQQHRARPAETTVFSVEADVVDCRLMPDGDYRVTVRGASGKTLALEMPDPAPEFVDPHGKFVGQIKESRDVFGAKFQPERKLKPVMGHARITGVGFFGRTYGSQKADGNLIQIHPVLKIEWLEKPTAEFAAPPMPDKGPPAGASPAPAKPPRGKAPSKSE
jgi:hypothetical protein